jgi:hypothetical protein
MFKFLKSLKILKILPKPLHKQTSNFSKVAVFSSKKYDIEYLEKVNKTFPESEHLKMDFFQEEINEKTAILTQGYDTIMPFVNDHINS